VAELFDRWVRLVEDAPCDKVHEKFVEEARAAGLLKARAASRHCPVLLCALYALSRPAWDMLFVIAELVDVLTMKVFASSQGTDMTAFAWCRCW